LDGDARRSAIVGAHRERRARVFELAVGKDDHEFSRVGRVVHADRERTVIEGDYLPIAVHALGPRRGWIRMDDGG
jgi:hypothetical protein